MACKECGNQIHGWITYHREGNDDYTAYCYECAEKDSAMTTDRKREPWTLRVRCGYWSNAKDGEPSRQCNQCWQISRTNGGGSA